MNLQKNLVKFLLRKLFIISLIIIFFALFFKTSFSQSQGDYRTVNNGNWTDAIWQRYDTLSGWNTIAPPTGSTNANISISFGTTVSLNTNFTVTRLTVGGTLTLDAGQALNIGNGTGNDLTIIGTISGANDINIQTGALVDFQNGTVSGTGAFNIALGATLNFSNSALNINRTINNGGTINWLGSSLSGTGTINNNGICNDQTSFGSSCNVAFTNSGTFNKNSNNQNLFFGNFQNPGIINITLGGIIINSSSGATVNGTVTVSSGCLFQFGNGTFTTFTIGANISGAGTVAGNSTSVNFTNACSYNITGTTTAYSGTMTFAAGMTLTNIGNITPAGGNITLSPGLTLGAYGPILRISGGGTFTSNIGLTYNFQKLFLVGTIAGSDSMTVSDSISFSSGLVSGTAAITLKSGGFGVVFNNGITLDKTFINNGTVNWTANSISGNGTIYNNSILTMSSNANSCGPLFVNAGTFTKSSTLVSGFSKGLNNTGTGIINITTTTLLVSPVSGTFSLAGNINITSGAILQLGNSSTATFNITANISGAGSFYGHSTAVNFLAGSAYNISGTTGTYSGNVTFNSGMTLTNIGSLTSNGGTINLQPGVTVSSIASALTITGGGVLNFNTGQNFQFTSVNAAGTIGGSDTIALSGNMVLTSGGITGNGPLNILSGSVLDLNSSGAIITKTINNAGTINWIAGLTSGAGVINNNNVFNISVTSNSTLGQLVNNNGTVNKGTSSAPFLTSGFINSGTMNITSGNLIVTPSTGTYTHSGNINISSGATLTLGAGSGNAIQNVNGQISGAGNASFGANTVNFGVSSVYNISGNTTVTFGSTNFNGGMTLANLGTFNCSGGTANFNSGLTISAYNPAWNIGATGTANFNTGKNYLVNSLDLAGTLGGTDSVFVNNTFNWTNGTVGNILILKPAVTVSLNTTNGVALSGKIINNGTFNWTQAGISGSGSFVNNNILNMNTTGTLTFGPFLINNSTVNKNSSTTTSIANTVTNNGNFNILSGVISAASGNNYGTVNLSGNTTLNINGPFSSWGTMVVPSNSFITGSGFFNCNSLSLVNDGNISANIQFDSITSVSGTGVFSNNITFLNGCNVTLASNVQFKSAIVNSGGSFNLNGYKLSFNGPNTPLFNNGTLNLNNSTIEYNGSASQGVQIINVIYKNLIINNPAGITFASSGTLTVNDTLKIISGFFDIGGSIVSLGSTGYLYEAPGSLVKGASGTITATRTLTNPVNVNVAGLGATISSPADMGNTTVSRGFTSYTINGSVSVKRYYSISPANNTNLNATLTYHYDNTELNGLNENFLTMYRSTNAGTNWTTTGGQRDTANNNITYSGINAFSYWTAGNNPLAASINITAIVDALYNTSTNMLNKKDTLTVYIRNSTAPYTAIDSAKILIDSVTFSANAYFNTTPSGTYYLSVKYRNALETWSKAGGESYTAGASMSYNFTSAQSQSYGNSTVLKNGKYVITSGDINQDGFVNGNDFTLFSQQFGQSGYLGADLNGDNVVNGNDFTSFSSSFGKQSSHP